MYSSQLFTTPIGFRVIVFEHDKEGNKSPFFGCSSMDIERALLHKHRWDERINELNQQEKEKGADNG